MGNIKNFNFNKLDLKLSHNDYWDFFLATDEGPTDLCNGLSSGDCFVVWYDFNNNNIYDSSATSATSIYSLVTWNEATNTGYTMNTAGLTGLDNGLFTFEKLSGDTSNQALSNVLTDTPITIVSGDTRLNLNRVTGTTGTYIYPIDILSDNSGNYTNLCGGFYQGYYKLDGNSYEVLPIRVNQAWSAEFWVKPQDLCSYTGLTLNDTYSNNKGFFFYMGTRAENKFWNEFEGLNTGCTSDCIQPTGCTDVVTEWCTVLKENEIILTGGTYGVAIPLNPPLINVDLVTNGFLIYGRAAKSGSTSCSTCGGPHDGLGTETVCTYDGNGKVVTTHSQEVTNRNNPFLIYGRAAKSGSTSSCRTCGGPHDGFGTETVCTFTGFTKDQTSLDYKSDIIDNALGFRIKDDGSIGYRLLTITGTCTSANTYMTGYTIEEGYSLPNIVSADTWSYIAIRFITEYKTDCELKTDKPRKGKLMFYVNAKLKFVVNDFDEFVARRLNDSFLKQVGVPFNFSLGGGTQGLIESQTFDGRDDSDKNLPIETNFAGSFIGGISQFKFNICDLTFCNIHYNYIIDLLRYNPSASPLLIIDENGNYLISEDGNGIL